MAQTRTNRRGPHPDLWLPQSGKECRSVAVRVSEHGHTMRLKGQRAMNQRSQKHQNPLNTCERPVRTKRGTTRFGDSSTS